MMCDKFMIDEFKNPDGSYNGIKMFSRLTGLPEAEVDRIWEKVKSDRNNNRPKCFGGYPIRYPHMQAEYDCKNCPWNHTCFEATNNARS